MVTHRGCMTHLVLYCGVLGFGGGRGECLMDMKTLEFRYPCRLRKILQTFVQDGSFYCLLLCFFKTHFNLVCLLDYALSLEAFFPLQTSQPSISMLPLFPHVCHMFCPSQSSSFDRPNKMFLEVRKVKLVTTQFSTFHRNTS
jgi:hypothetical protein